MKRDGWESAQLSKAAFAAECEMQVPEPYQNCITVYASCVSAPLRLAMNPQGLVVGWDSSSPDLCDYRDKHTEGRNYCGEDDC